MGLPESLEKVLSAAFGVALEDYAKTLSALVAVDLVNDGGMLAESRTVILGASQDWNSTSWQKVRVQVGQAARELGHHIEVSDQSVGYTVVVLGSGLRLIVVVGGGSKQFCALIAALVARNIQEAMST